MNVGTFAGRLGRDADLRSTPSGQQVLNFSLAVDAGFGDSKHTLWVGCALWGERAAKLEQYLVKGKQVTVSGDIDLRFFEKRDNTQGAEITLNVQRLTLQGGRDDAAPAEPQQTKAPATTQRAPQQRELVTAAPTGGKPDFDDDIPF